MKRWVVFGMCSLAVLALMLPGCDDAYSDAVRYTVRTDPIPHPTNKLTEEPLVPDPPGQLPLLSVADFHDMRNPYFKKNQELIAAGKDLIKSDYFRDPNLMSTADRQIIQKGLEDLYGTPAQPKVADIDTATESLLKLSKETLAKGSKVYRINCLHCHGVTGDGRGPTARWVNPHPRDYRQGKFKFQSVDQTDTNLGVLPPHRDDILRVFEIGVEGTAMPSFVVLPEDERDALASYVIHLSIRGQTEIGIINRFTYDAAKNTLTAPQPDADDSRTLTDRLKAAHATIVGKWVMAQNNRIKVPAYPSDLDLKKSILSGKEIFEAKYPEKNPILGADGCKLCHANYGRQATFRFDEWGTLTRPNNFTMGVFRGGHRPEDIYRRIHSGILPSGMIAFGRAGSGLSSDKIWDLVNFVQALGNPNMRKIAGIQID